MLTLPEESAEVVEAEEESPGAEEAVSSALPGLGAFPDPAPDEEPAVLEVAVEDALLVSED